MAAAVAFVKIKLLYKQTCVTCNAGCRTVLSNSGQFTGINQPDKSLRNITDLNVVLSSVLLNTTQYYT